MCQIFATCYSIIAFLTWYGLKWHLYFIIFLFIFLSHPTLSHLISTSPNPALSPPSLSNHPLSSEGWVPMWVYSGVVGRSELGCGEVGHGLTAKVGGFWWVCSNGVWGGFLHRFFFFLNSSLSPLCSISLVVFDVGFAWFDVGFSFG